MGNSYFELRDSLRRRAEAIEKAARAVVEAKRNAYKRCDCRACSEPEHCAACMNMDPCEKIAAAIDTLAAAMDGG